MAFVPGPTASRASGGQGPFVPVGATNRDKRSPSVPGPANHRDKRLASIYFISLLSSSAPTIRCLPYLLPLCSSLGTATSAASARTARPAGRQPPQPPEAGRRQQGRLLQGAPARGQKLPDLGLRLRLWVQHGRAAHHQPRTATPASRSVSPPCALMRDGGHGVGPRRAATRGGGAGLRRAWRR